MKKHSILLLGALSWALCANAVPAKKGLFEYRQPDGTSISLRLVGDEHAHYYLTDDNFPVLADEQGTFRYASVDALGNVQLSKTEARNSLARTFEETAELTASDFGKFDSAMRAKAASRKSRRAAAQNGMGLFTGNYPRSGKVRSLVFLVEYQDVKFNTTAPAEYFDRLFNEEGFSDNGGTGSARDYFLYQSGGVFDVTFDVYGPVTLSQNRSYYGANSRGEDVAPEQMVIEAARQLDSKIDYSQYDYDGDGCVDNIFLIYAGEGEASGGPAESVWPHAWELPSPITLDGKTILGYACTNEWDSDNTPAGIGTACHEFSHVLGLPDLYSTSSDLTCTPDEWSVMDYGPYNNDGNTPPNYSAFERNAMQWIDPIELVGPDKIDLGPLHSTNTAYLIPTEKTTEFFLIENRQQEGWDTYLPYHGMLVWHIDFVQSVWDDNSVNNTRTHQYVDIVEANNNPNSMSATALKGYPFPGTSRKTAFTAETTPALVSWSKKAIDLPLTEITENSDGTISFLVAGGLREIDAPANVQAVAGNDGTMTISWEPSEGAMTYLIDIRSKDENDKLMPVGAYTAFDAGNVTTHTAEGLESETEYFVTVTASCLTFKSEPSEEISVVTPAFAITYSAPTAIEGFSSNGDITCRWLPMKNAVSYMLTIVCEADSESSEITADFGTTTSLAVPEGWTWSGSSSDYYRATSIGYFGENAPALKFASDGATLTTELYQQDISHVAFWARGANAGSGSYFEVLGRGDNAGAWTTLYSIDPMEALNSAGEIQEFEPEAGIRQLSFVYHKTSGNAALDDIVISLRSTNAGILEGYDRFDNGASTEHTANVGNIDGKLRFFVEARDADGNISKASNTVEITDGVNTGIGTAPSAGWSILTAGRTIIYNGTPFAEITVADLTGRIAATIKADSDGNASCRLPGGFYIISTPGGTCKTVLR